MDPASIAGIVGTAGAIVKSIASTIKSLNDVRGKFEAADWTIRLLISELSTIKSALNQIHDWAEYNLTDTQARRLGDNLDITLDGCRLAMDILASDVADLLGIDSVINRGRPVHLGFWERSKLVWNESAVKDHQERLSRQTSALQLLLMAIQCRSISEQAELLREPENIQKIQDVADDTSTVRAARSQVGSTGTPSIRSHDDSTISGRAFPWDDQLVTSQAYRRVLQHHRSRSDVQGADRQPRLEVPPPDVPRDEGYETRSGTTGESVGSPDHLSPIWTRENRRPPLVRPYETHSVASDPDAMYRSRSLRDPVVPFMSETNLGRLQADQARTRELGKKRSFWSNVSRRRKSDTSPSSPLDRPGSKSPTPSSRRGRRGFENKFHTSIDFGSPDGINCPPIVRAAQAGSIVEVESLLDNHAGIEECHRSTGRNAMAVAAHCGNEEVVELLLRYGANITTRDAFGNTPLHLASSRGHVGVMNILLSEMAPIEDKGPDGKTPLQLSCDNGQFEAAALLLMSRAKVNARDKNNLCSIHTASARGDAEIVDLLIRNGAHIEAKDSHFMAAIHYASENGHDAVVDLLLNKKAEIDAPGKDAKTPLICAAAAGHASVVELLLRRKASLKKRGAGSMNCLHWSAFMGHVEVVDLLTQRKAPLNEVNADGRMALHLAVMAEQFPVVELLLRKNAPLEAQCTAGFRPLHYACSVENPDVVRLLLHSGANVEAEAVDRRRPLHLAVAKGVLPSASMLIEQGAHVESRDAAGDRPLLLAAAAGHTEVVKRLLDAGAPLRSKFSAGPSHEDSPLCVAARAGHLQTVVLLINRGASVRQKDEFDWQPLRYAAHYGHPEIVERLLLYGATISGHETWGFSLTADRIGFAKNVYISEDRQEAVLRLLKEAEEREHLTQQRETQNAQPSSRFPGPIATLPQTEASELDHGMDIQRPPRTELFSPDNARYTQTRPPDQTSPPDPAAPSAPSPYQSTPDEPRASGFQSRPSAISAMSADASQRPVSAYQPPDRGQSTVSAISPAPSMVEYRPFTYQPTPISTPAPSETVGGTASASGDTATFAGAASATTYRDTLRAWSSSIPPTSTTEPDSGPPATTSTTTTTPTRTNPPLPPRTQPAQQLYPLPASDTTPNTPTSRHQPNLSTSSSTTEETPLRLTTLVAKVARRRELGLTTFSAPGDIVWDLSDLETMIEGYQAAGITLLGRAQDGFPPYEGSEAGGGGVGDSTAAGNTRERFARSTEGVFEMA